MPNTLTRLVDNLKIFIKRGKECIMTVSSISTSMSATQWGAYQQKLSEATKAELEKLNIPYTDSTTESQAKILIDKAKEQQAQEETNSNAQNGTSTDELLEQAKKLAQKIGLSVDENISFEELMTKLETTLEEKIKASSDNVQMLNQLKEYSRQLATLQAQSVGSSGMDSTNQALMMSLEMLGQYNKSFLNN